jgi:transcription elongation factor GreB
MSKAFTRERDEDLDDDDNAQEESAGPAKNYMTPRCYERLHSELLDLKNRERPEVTKIVQWAAGNGDRSENADYTYGKKRLREIDRRMRFLSKRLETAVVVDPKTLKSDTVLFGATVTVRFEDDAVKTYSIVGVDEVDVNRGRISWMSPLATVLFKAKVGDFVTFRSPKGVQEIEIERIEYKELG